MPRSPAGTSKQALSRIQRLCCLGVGSEMLMPDLMREVMAFIPSRGGLFFWVGPKPEAENTYATFSTGILARYLKEFYSTRQESELLRPLFRFATWPVSRVPSCGSSSSCASISAHSFAVITTIISGGRSTSATPSCWACERGRDRGLLEVFRARGKRAFESQVESLEVDRRLRRTRHNRLRF